MSTIGSLPKRSSQAVLRALAGAEGRYLTDGTRVFRQTAALDRCPAGFVWLEDCGSLTVVATAGEVAQLMPVHAADEDPEPR